MCLGLSARPTHPLSAGLAEPEPRALIVVALDPGAEVANVVLSQRDCALQERQRSRDIPSRLLGERLRQQGAVTTSLITSFRYAAPRLA